MATNPTQGLLTPTFTQLLERVIAAGASQLFVATWGVVESYDSELQEAQVQLVPRNVYVDATGTRQTERRAQLLDVPVFLPQSGGRGVTFGVSPGDFVLVLFLDQAAEGWFRVGGSDVDPGDDRRHSMSDAVAVVGLSPRPSRLDAPPQNTVVQDPSKVQLGSKSASHAVLTDADASYWNAALAAAIASLTPPDGPDSSNPLAPAALLALATLQTALSAPGVFWGRGSDKVKADLD